MSKLSAIATNEPDSSEDSNGAVCSDSTRIDGACCSATLSEVCFLNAPDNESSVIATTGHAALLLASATYGFELYNFSPFDNKSAFAQGAIAQTVDTIDSFDAFVERCVANNFDGIEIQNG